VCFGARVGFSQTEAAVVETWAEGETVVVVTNRGGVVSHRVVGRSTRSGKPAPPPVGPVEPVDPESLAGFVRAAAGRVAEHDRREAAAGALSAFYGELARTVREDFSGSLSQRDANRVKSFRDDGTETLLNALGVATEWAGFVDELRAELTRRQLGTAEAVATAFDEVATGLQMSDEAKAAAFNPEIIPAVLDLIKALQIEDKTARRRALIAAGVKIALLLITSGGF